MNTSSTYNRAPDSMTIRELAHLRLLNDRLAYTERWMREQIAVREHTEGNAGVQARVFFHWRAQWCVFESGAESELAKRDGQSCETPCPQAAPLADMPMCTSFAGLHRQLDYDWSALLDVDCVRVHVSITVCRDFHVWG